MHIHMQAKSKKDAKQLAAAALLEVMLDHVPFQDLLYKSEKQQSFKEIQVWGTPLPVLAVASLQLQGSLCASCKYSARYGRECAHDPRQSQVLGAAQHRYMASSHSTGKRNQ